MANTPVPIAKGAVKFKSIKALAEASGVPYITLYMRMRNGMTPSQAFHKPVRSYKKRMTSEHEPFTIVPVDIYQQA